MTNTLPSNEFNGVSSDVANDHDLSTGNLSLIDIPLIAGESTDDLERFRVSAMDAIKPRDAIEAIWLQDFICYTWESMRLRRQKTETIINDRARVLYNQFVDCSPRDFDREYTGQLTRRWVAGDADAKAEVDQFLRDQHISEDTLTTKTFQANLEKIGLFDKLISHYDHRRDTAIKELEKRRDTLARRAYVFAQTFSDADFEEDESA